MSLKQEIARYCRKVYEQGFTAATDGNLSVRFSGNITLITRSGISKGDVEEKDIIACDPDGNVVMGNGRASTEIKLHQYIYKKRKEINAVIHCHPVYATAFAVTGKTLDVPVFPEVILTLGRIPLCRYATPSTEALAESLSPYIDYANVFLLENHGAVSVGKNLKEAFYRMEKLEHYAKSLSVAHSLGGVKELSRENLRELYAAAEKVYGIKLHEKNKF